MQVETSLVQACIKQDRKAQKELYLLLLPYLRAVAGRYLKNDSYVKDALQEAFVKIFRNMESYDPERAPLKNWAARIVINVCINYNERVIGKVTEELVDDYQESPTLPLSLAEASDDKLLRVLKQMPKGYFEVFNLFVIDGYSHKEITGMLGISEALSRKKLSRANSWLQKMRATI